MSGTGDVLGLALSPPISTGYRWLYDQCIDQPAEKRYNGPEQTIFAAT